MSDKIDIVRLAGDKIDLCILRTDDEAIDAYTRWRNDASINIWIGDNRNITQWSEELDWATMDKQSDKSCQFCIVEKVSRKLIGTCSCGCYDGISAYLGITIGEPEGQNRGYGTEVIRMLVKFCFNELNAHRVELEVVGDNARAIKCYSKAGFVECGRSHEANYHNGHYCDQVQMEILREDWKNNL